MKASGGFPLTSSDLCLSVLSGVFICGVLSVGVSGFSAGLSDVGLLGGVDPSTS